MTPPGGCDIVVIGAGHAGCEAALAAARRGHRTLLLTQHLDAIARMSCNPAIGGIAKGQLVRELDALGGEMGWVTDTAGLQFRMLNTSRGAAVRSPRAQCDKQLYHLTMKQVLERQEGLALLQGEAVRLLIADGRAAGVELADGSRIPCAAVVLTAGTFLNGVVHLGMTRFPGGRFAEPPATGLSAQLASLGFAVRRLKTGTPPRVNSATVDRAQCQEQPGDDPPQPFSHFTDAAAWRDGRRQLPCWLTYTSPETHAIIRENLDRSPLYAGAITGIGPRYCPSIEDKVVRFPDRERHQVFLEPEGFSTNEMYVNGISTSLPADVQQRIVRSIPGLAQAAILRFGYAIEYDFFPPDQLRPTLESKAMPGLYCAGQVNGTTGYEEAAAQGLVAGVNASLSLSGREPLVLARDEAYIGVMIDDLVTRGVDEPYRMFTARAEYRLSLRTDNADLRLMDRGYTIGLISDRMYERFRAYRDAVAACARGAAPAGDVPAPWSMRTVEEQAAIERHYAGYIARQRRQAAQLRGMDGRRIPPDLDYAAVPSLGSEARQKLARVRPETVGQASRIPGLSPADIAVLLIAIEKRKKAAHP